jgi:hypothetical protein
MARHGNRRDGREIAVFGDGAGIACRIEPMRSLSRFAVLAALLGTGLPAWANPQANPPVNRPANQSTPGATHQVAAPSPTSPAAPPAQPAVEAPRASVAAIMQEAGQALLWDVARGEYVVVRAGASFHEFQVSALSAEQVVLSRGNQHFVLPRTSEVPDLARRSHAGAAASAQPALAQGYLEDPFAPAGAPAPAPDNQIVPASALPTGAAPVDPYGAPASAGQVPALLSPHELPPAEGPMVLDPYAPTAAAPAAPALPSSLLESRVKPRPRSSTDSSAPVAANDTPRVTSMPRPVIQPQNEAASMRDEQHSLSRKEFDAAISDFDALGRDIQVALAADGVRVDEVASGSLAYRMGIRAGDVVLDVDGKKLRSVNDAAAIYARLMDAEQFAVKVRRGTGVITLRYRFTR